MAQSVTESEDDHLDEQLNAGHVQDEVQNQF